MVKYSFFSDNPIGLVSQWCREMRVPFVVKLEIGLSSVVVNDYTGSKVLARMFSSSLLKQQVSVLVLLKNDDDADLLRISFGARIVPV